MSPQLRSFAANAARSIGLKDTLENIYRIIIRGKNAIKADRIQSEQKAQKDYIFKPMQGRDGEYYPFHVLVLTDPEWVDHKADTNAAKIEGIFNAERQRREARRYIEQHPLEFL